MNFCGGESFSGDEELCCGDEVEVAVEAVEGSSFEVVQPGTGLWFLVAATRLFAARRAYEESKPLG